LDQKRESFTESQKFNLLPKAESLLQRIPIVEKGLWKEEGEICKALRNGEGLDRRGTAPYMETTRV
jgi:hypothetical protein